MRSYIKRIFQPMSWPCLPTVATSVGAFFLALTVTRVDLQTQYGLSGWTLSRHAAYTPHRPSTASAYFFPMAVNLSDGSLFLVAHHHERLAGFLHFHDVDSLCRTEHGSTVAVLGLHRKSVETCRRGHTAIHV